MTHPIPTRCLGITAAVVFSAVTALAQTITVGPSGSTAQYNNIADGIAAVPPGGVVLVAAGAYADTEGLTINKPMTLLGAGSSQTSFETSSNVPFVPVPLTIKNLSAGEEVVVAGLELSLQSTFFGAVASAVAVRDCAGIVAIIDVAGITADAKATAGVAIVRNSKLVTMDGCSFVTGPSIGGPATPGISVTDSLVRLSDCVIQGGTSHVPLGASVPHNGAAGIAANDAIVRLARSVVMGGDGADPGPLTLVSTVTVGGAAVDAASSQVLVRGASGNLLKGGMGGRTNTNPVLFGAGGPAIHLDATSLGSTTPDVVMAAGPDGDNQLTTPPVSGLGLHAALAFPLPILATATKLVAPGNVAAFEVAGEPGAVCLSLLSLHQADALAVPGILGVFTLQFPAVVSLPTVILDAAGTGGFSVQLPANPTLTGIAAYSQAVSFAPSGWIAVSAPASFAVR